MNWGEWLANVGLTAVAFNIISHVIIRGGERFWPKLPRFWAFNRALALEEKQAERNRLEALLADPESRELWFRRTWLVIVFFALVTAVFFALTISFDWTDEPGDRFSTPGIARMLNMLGALGSCTFALVLYFLITSNLGELQELEKMKAERDKSSITPLATAGDPRPTSS